MTLDSEVLAQKCEERATALLSRFPRGTLPTVGDLAQVLRDLAKDIRDAEAKE